MSKIKFVLLFFWMLFSGYSGLQAQTDLVIWNNHTSTPTPEVANITANQMVLGGGVSVQNFGWSGFIVNELHNGINNTINYNKYIEFRITPNAGYKIALSQFKLIYNSPTDGAGPTKLQVRYSTNSSFPSNGTLLASEQTLTQGSNQSLALNFPASYEVTQTLYLRVYAYGHANLYYTNFFIRNTVYNPSTEGPTISGEVLSALPPVAANDSENTAENTSANFDILTNDTYNTLSAITITDQPDHGSNITVNGLTNVTYTPNSGYTGADSFKYTITDENGTSNEATVTIDVVPVEAPTAVADNVSAIKNETKIINVLTNDTQGSGAFDEVVIISNPTDGTAIVNPNNTVSYTPDTNYTGADSFQYEVSNIHNTTSNTVTVSIDVLDPVGLVTWNGAGGSFTPNVTATHITASNLTNHGGGTLIANNWAPNQNFEVGNWPATFNESRYVQFTITADPNYKIDLNRFNVEIQMNGGGANSANFELRYSKNFLEGYSSINGIISGNGEGNWDIKSWDLSAINSVLPEETAYIRLYVYGNVNNKLRIRNSWGGSTGPTITGAVSQSISGDPADLEITKTMNNDTPEVDDEVTYTIVVENLDPSNTASGVVVIDELPVGFTYVSDNSLTGSYDEITGIWDIGSLANGASATLEITAEKQASGPYTNTASVSHNGTDNDPSNDSSSITPSNACAGCTHNIPNGSGHIEVLSGQTWCLHSGIFTGTFNIQDGGVICIGEGAEFLPTGPADPNDLNGTIINRGEMEFPLYSDDGPHTGTIINYAIYNTSQIQGFAGTIENYGTIANSGGTSFLSGASMINSGIYTATTFQNFDGTLNNSGTFTISNNAAFLEGASIVNEGDMYFNNVDFDNVTITNYDYFEANAGFDFLGASGYFENKSGATVILNPTSGSTEITSPFDNSGTAQIYRANSGGGISTVVNNYGTMQIYQNIIFGLDTYLTNDGTLEFHDAASVEFQGPLLQNNDLLTIFDGGNLSLNSSISQMVNNKKVVVGGSVSHNIAGSSIINNCTILSEDYFVGNGTSENNGLIWVNDYFELEGTLSILINSATGFIRGTRFRNSGQISGYGSFYFTGNTNFQSAGSFEGDDPASPMQFFDTTQTGDDIFDVWVEDNPAINVIRPESMTPLDDTTYNCSAPPTTAGYPPATEVFEDLFCAPTSLTFDIGDYVEPHAPVEGNNFTLLYSSIRLFDANDDNNPTNNSTSLTIAGKGVLSVNTSTGIISFTPNGAFTDGVFEAEYRISNQWAGNPPIMPSPRTKITITFISINPPAITIESGTNPVCIDDTVTLSNGIAGGVWESSNDAIATVDANGVVTGIASGTVTITYTLTEEGCEEYVEQEIVVESCEPPNSGLMITNPMIRSRIKPD